MKTLEQLKEIHQALTARAAQLEKDYLKLLQTPEISQAQDNWCNAMAEARKYEEAIKLLEEA